MLIRIFRAFVLLIMSIGTVFAKIGTRHIFVFSLKISRLCVGIIMGCARVFTNLLGCVSEASGDRIFCDKTKRSRAIEIFHRIAKFCFQYVLITDVQDGLDVHIFLSQLCWKFRKKCFNFWNKFSNNSVYQEFYQICFKFSLKFHIFSAHFTPLVFKNFPSFLKISAIFLKNYIAILSTVYRRYQNFPKYFSTFFLNFSWKIYLKVQ